MPPWPNFPPWPCLDSQLPSNTELSLLCHKDESGRTLRLRTNIKTGHSIFDEYCSILLRRFLAVMEQCGRKAEVTLCAFSFGLSGA